MNKTLFLWLFVSFFVSSCSFKKDTLPEDSSAAINTIAVIIDDQLWNGVVGDSIRNKFASPVLGLPQEEPLFSINQYPVKLFEGFSTDSRNILIVKKSNENKFEFKENEFVTPQNSFYISGKTSFEILETLNFSNAISYIIVCLILSHSFICSLVKLTNFLFFLAIFPSPKPISSLLFRYSKQIK